VSNMKTGSASYSERLKGKKYSAMRFFFKLERLLYLGDSAACATINVLLFLDGCLTYYMLVNRWGVLF
jgi:hypothetical protein